MCSIGWVPGEPPTGNYLHSFELSSPAMDSTLMSYIALSSVLIPLSRSIQPESRIKTKFRV
jgi:hypothetical protein